MAAPELNIHGLTRPELAREFLFRGLTAHQARLTFQAIYRHGLFSPGEMPEISATCRKFLASLPPPPQSTLDEVRHALDGTIKLRVKTAAGDAVESVIIPAQRRLTLCVSSQVGCAAGCTFCHTGTMGLLRNLSAWEILEQLRLANKVVAEKAASSADSTGGGGGAKPPRVTNIVFMGMGEPLHNEANVLQACRILNDDVGAGFSRRHIIMSSAGVGNRIRPFWEQNAALIAVSLHATTDEQRSRIVPLNRQWNVDALRQILLDIPWRNGESVTIAYLLLDGFNDSKEDALRLAGWIKGLPAKINLLSKQYQLLYLILMIN